LPCSTEERLTLLHADAALSVAFVLILAAWRGVAAATGSDTLSLNSLRCTGPLRLVASGLTRMFTLSRAKPLRLGASCADTTPPAFVHDARNSLWIIYAFHVTTPPSPPHRACRLAACNRLQPP
jgi:hypothetical protein